MRRYVFIDQLPPLGVYPKELETYATFDGQKIFFRPVKPTDEPLLQDLFYALSEESIYYRFFSSISVMPHSQVQRFATVDYEKELAIVGVIQKEDAEEIIAVGRYVVEPETRMAEAALVVRDDWQGKGIGTWLQNYLIEIAKDRGIVGFKARVLPGNTRVFHLAHKSGFTVQTTLDEDGIYVLSYKF